MGPEMGPGGSDVRSEGSTEAMCEVISTATNRTQSAIPLRWLSLQGKIQAHLEVSQHVGLSYVHSNHSPIKPSTLSLAAADTKACTGKCQ